jgi:hypothetical protein
MPNKNFQRKSACSHLFPEACMCESCLTIKEVDKPLAARKFEFYERYIMSRRPTKLSLELLSRAKANALLPEVTELPQKEGAAK